MRRIAIVAAALGFAAAPQIAPAAQCAASSALDGTFKANDKGSYQIRQVGNVVWWIGKSSDNGASWTNIFRGIRKGNLVSGSWADVAPGGGSGTLTLTVTANNQLHRISGDGSGFAGSIWLRPGCTYSNGTPID